LPALNLLLEHESAQQEAGQMRQVKLALKAVALGALAERLQQQALGSAWRFSGFLMSPRGGAQPVFHITDFQPF
jgi:primosomal replication protein N